MAYRFNGSSDVVDFNIAPFNGYTVGPITVAALVKRGATGQHAMVSMHQATPSFLARATHRFIVASDLQTLVVNGAASQGTSSYSSTTAWILVVATLSASGASARFHSNVTGTWLHQAGSPAVGGATTVAGTDQLRVGMTDTGSKFNGDICCVGMKKSDSTDVAIETLSLTSFQAWRNFGFDWLIGFDSSLVSAGKLQDQASPGTGDETTRVGTTAVSDPPGWSWTAPAPVADFTGTPLTGNHPLSVAFTDASTNTPTSWAWTFGDGGTSTVQNPTHVYATAGTYTVTLQATNAGGSNTKTRTGYITVGNAGGTMTKIKWGDHLQVTDEGGGVIRVDYVP